MKQNKLAILSLRFLSIVIWIVCIIDISYIIQSFIQGLTNLQDTLSPHYLPVFSFPTYLFSPTTLFPLAAIFLAFLILISYVSLSQKWSDRIYRVALLIITAEALLQIVSIFLPLPLTLFIATWILQILGSSCSQVCQAFTIQLASNTGMWLIFASILPTLYVTSANPNTSIFNKQYWQYGIRLLIIFIVITIASNVPSIQRILQEVNSFQTQVQQITPKIAFTFYTPTNLLSSSSMLNYGWILEIKKDAPSNNQPTTHKGDLGDWIRNYSDAIYYQREYRSQSYTVDVYEVQLRQPLSSSQFQQNDMTEFAKSQSVNFPTATLTPLSINGHPALHYQDLTEVDSLYIYLDNGTRVQLFGDDYTSNRNLTLDQMSEVASSLKLDQ